MNPSITAFEEIDYWMSCTVLKEFNGVRDLDAMDSALKTFITDYQRVFPDTERVDLQDLRLYPCLQAVLLYRVAHEYYLLKDEADALVFSTLGRILSGTEIYYSADIGEGFLLHHGLGTVIGARCKIGNNCTVYQGVTLGDKDGRPSIGDNVVIYTGAIVIGNITIGSNSVVGAGSVCIKNVPHSTTVAGVPAKIIDVNFRHYS